MAKKKSKFPALVVTVPASITVDPSYVESAFEDFVDNLPEVALGDDAYDAVTFDEAMTIISPEAFAEHVRKAMEANLASIFNTRNTTNSLYRLEMYPDSFVHDIIKSMGNITKLPAFKAIAVRKQSEQAEHLKKHQAGELKKLRVKAASLGFKLVKED